MQEREPDPAELVRIGGMAFRRVRETSAAHKAWVLEESRRSGIDVIMTGFLSRNEAIDRVLAAGRLTYLVAAELEEEGTVWSPQQAERNARFFASLTSPSDKAVLRQLLNSIVSQLLDYAETAIVRRVTQPARLN